MQGNDADNLAPELRKGDGPLQVPGVRSTLPLGYFRSHCTNTVLKTPKLLAQTTLNLQENT